MCHASTEDRYTYNEAVFHAYMFACDIIVFLDDGDILISCIRISSSSIVTIYMIIHDINILAELYMFLREWPHAYKEV